MFVTTVANAANLLSKQYIGSVYYNFYDDGTAEATYGTLQSPENYSGDIQIRSKVTLNGKSYTVTAIGEDAFYRCTKMTSIFIPNTVKTIGATSFLGCTGLTEINIPESVQTLFDKAFYQCDHLKTVDMTDASLKTFGENVFVGCNRLESISLPKSLEIIPEKAFYQCLRLKSIIAPEPVMTIGEKAFYGCSSLTNVDLSKSKLIKIGAYAFAECTNITEISLPNTLEVISEYAFYCNYTNNGCKSIKIPNSVKKIEKYAFANFQVLSTIELGESLEYIGDYAFYYKITERSKCVPITFEDYEIEKRWEVVNSFWYQCGDDKDCLWEDYDYVEYEIPFTNTVLAYGMQLSPCTSLEIPNSVKSIGKSAFANFSNLSSIKFGKALESIGDYAFYCDKEKNYNGYAYGSNKSTSFFQESVNTVLEKLDFPESLVSIGNSAFPSFRKLSKVKFPSSLKSIGTYAFSDCSSLDSIEIPNSVSSVGKWAFSDCSALKEVKWSNSSSIPECCFNNCTSLKAFTIPNGVTSINDGAFYQCKNLGSITIPSSVKNINIDYYWDDGSSTSSLRVFSGCTECIVYLCNDNISPNHSAFKPVKKVATCDNVPMPVEINYAFFYTGEEQLYNIPENAAYTITGNRRTEEGSQDVVIALKDGFIWTNGTSDTLTFDFTIYSAKLTPEQTVIKGYLGQKLSDLTMPKGCEWVDDPSYVLEYAGESKFAVKYTPAGWTKDPLLIEMTVIVSKIPVEFPLADSTVYTYDGKEHTYKIAESEFYKVMNSANLTKKDAGSYEIVVSLTNKANYEWSNGTTDSRTYNFIIKKDTVNIPEVVESKYVYTGDEITFKIEESPLYTISNNVGKEFGSYNATVSLKDKDNYVWSDGTDFDRSFTFMITRPMVKIPAEDATEFIYTGEALTYNIPESPSYTVTNNVHTDVGYYYVEVSLKDPYNNVWEDGTNGTKTYYFNIKKPYVKKPEFTSQSFVFNGKPQTYVVAEDAHYKISGNVQTNVGWHTVCVSLTDPSNYAWEDGTTWDQCTEFEIKTRKVLIPQSTKEDFVYNGKEQTYPIASDDAFFTVIGYDYNTGWYGSDSTQTNAGSYNVILQLKDRNNMMWVNSMDDGYGTTSNQIYSFTINRAYVTSFPAGLAPEDLQLEAYYNDSLREVELPKEYRWVAPYLSVGSVGINYFGAYFAPGDFSNYYETIVDVPVNVKALPVSEPDADPTLFYYLAKPQVYTLETSDLYTVKNNVQTYVGTHDVVVSLKDTLNYAWKSTGKSDDLIYPFVISKSDEAMFELGYNPNEINPRVQYGQKLGDVTLPSRFSWKNPETIADKIGDNKYTVIYTPSDPDNYNSIEVEVVVNVTKRKVAYPEKDSRLFVYNGEKQTYEVGKNDLFKVSNNVQTNAGRYDVIVSLKDKEHYEWNDGTTDDIYQDFIIRTKSIEMPSVESKSFVYDGKSHSLTIPTSSYYTISGNKGTDAGRYEVSLSLVDKKNYVWENNTTADIVASFTITKIKVDMPAADNSSFTYNGEAQTYKIAASDLYTVAGNVQTAAGRYDVKVSLNNSRNYEWMDGTTDNLVYVFYIKSLGAETNLAKVEIPSVKTKKFVYDGNNHNLGLVDTDEYTVTDEGGANVGRYVATLSLKDKDKYVWENGLSDDVTISYLISKAQVAIPAKDTKTYTYNAKNQTYTVTENSLYTVSNNIKKNAGRYEVVVSLVDPKNYEWEDATSDDIAMIFKIGKATVAIPAADKTSFTYTGEAQTYTIANNTRYTVSNNVQTNVGTYEVKVSLKDTKNYMWTDGTIYDLSYNFVIKTEQVDQTVVKIPTVTTRNFIYNGKIQTLDIPESDDYIITDNKRVNAGRYVATLTLRDPINTVWSDGTKEDIQYVFNIAKATIDIPEIDHTRFVYTGKPQTYKIADSDYYTVSGNMQTKVGQYEVVVALNDVKNYMWNDGTVDDLSYSFVIRAEEAEKKEIAIPTLVDREFIYNGKAQSLDVKSNDYYIVYNNKGVNVGRYTVKLSLVNPETTVWENGSSEDVLVTFVISKSQVEIPAADNTLFTYNEDYQTYKIEKSPLYTVNYNEQLNAGKYAVQVSLVDAKNYKWSDGTIDDLKYSFVINKAKVEIPAADDSKFVYTGKAQTYKIAEDDHYKVENNKQTMPGKYEVLVSLSDSKNYEWTNGTTDVLSYNFVIRAEEAVLTSVAIPSGLNKNFVYDGTTKSLKIASSKYYKVSGNSGVNAGRYIVTLSLTDPATTVWSDGSTEDVKISFTIAKAQVGIPDADESKYIYTGKEQTYLIAEDTRYSVDGNVKIASGKYDVLVSLKDSKNYEWSDGSIDDLHYNFTIAKAQVEIPTADNSKFVYTGKAQTYMLETSPYYAIEGDIQTMPGKHEVLVSLVDPKNYEWTNGTTEALSYNFVIRAEEAELISVAIPTVTTKNFTYNGKTKSLNIANSDYYTISGNKGVDAGRYTVTLSLTDPTKAIWSDGSVDDIKMTFTIERAKISAPEVNNNKFVYNGYEYDYFENRYGGAYTFSNNIQTNAGRYVVTVALDDAKNHEWSDGSIDDLSYIFVINKAQVEIPAADESKFIYNGKVQTYDIAEDSRYTIEGNKQTMPGKHEVLVSLNDVKNYEWENGTTDVLSYNFVIRAEETELTPVVIPTVLTRDFIYDGTAKSLKIASSKYYTVSGNKGVDAGRYTVTLSLTDPNTTVWSDGSVDDIKMTFTIAKAQVEMPKADNSKFVYNGKEHTYTIAENERYTIDGNKHSMPGKYYVYVSLNDTKNYEWSNGTTDILSYSFVISVEETELNVISIPTVLTKNFIYDGTVKSLNINKNNYFKVSGNSGVDAGRYSVTLSLMDPVNTVWSDGSTDDIKMTFTIAKAQVEIPEADNSKFVYTGKDQYYYLRDSSVYTISNNIQKNAGRYEVSVSLKDAKNYEWEDGSVDDVVYGFVISKAQVNIPNADTKSYVYNRRTQIYKITSDTAYTVSGNGHVNAGSYIVSVTLNDTKNYMWTDGTVDIQKYNFVINKAQISKPSADNTVFVYDGLQKTYKIAESTYYTIKGDKQTLPGKYEVIVSLSDLTNYEWNDGTSSDLIYSFVIRHQDINKKSIEIPTVIEKTFVYDGTVKSLEINKTAYFSVSGNEGINAGRYMVTLSLNDPDMTVWSDGSTADVKIAFTINRAQVEIPEADQSRFVYTGKELTYNIAEDSRYSIEGNVQTMPGKHEVLVSLTDSKNYEWENGTTDVLSYNFVIRAEETELIPVAIPTVSTKNFIYDGSEKSLKIASNDYYEVSGNSGVNAGRYVVTLSLNDPTKAIWSDGSIDDVKMVMTIDKAKVEIPEADPTRFVYNGKNQTYGFFFSDFYQVSNDVQKSVGKYAVNVSLYDPKNYEWEDGTIDDLTYSFIINKAKVEIPASDTSYFVFNSEYQTYNVEESNLYSVAGNRQINVGNHDVVISLNDTKNYEWKDGTVSDIVYSFLIVKQEIDITTVKIPVVENTNFTYNSNSHTLEIPENDNYTIVGNVKTLAGKYLATVSLKDKTTMVWEDGSTDDIKIPFVITKATVKIPEADTTVFEYNGEEHVYGIPENRLYKISGNVQTLVGRHLVTVSLADYANYMWSDGTSNDLQYEFVINMKEVNILPVAFPVVTNTNFIYNGKLQSFDIKKSSYYTISGNNAVSAGYYKAIVSLKDKETTSWEDGTTADLVIPFSIAKAEIAIPSTDSTRFVYTGDTLTYSVAENSNYVVSGNANVKAGNYKARVSLIDKANTVWENGSSDDILIPYSIAKINVEKPASDSTVFVYNGDTMTLDVPTNEWYNVSDNYAVKAGKYSANISLVDKSNTVWNDGTTDDVVIPFTIEKSKVEIPVVDTTLFVYTGDTLTYTIAENEYYTIKGNAQAMVGRYSVVVTLNDIENYSWSDGTTLNLIYPFIVNEREVVMTQIPFPVINAVDLVYNGEMQTFNIDADTNCVINGNVRRDAGKYIATVSLADKNTMVWVDGTTEDILVPFTIAKAQVEIPVADTTVFEFTGEEQTFMIPEDSLYTIDGNVQTNVGRYDVYVSLVDINNYEWSNGTTGDVAYRFAIIHPIVKDTINPDDVKLPGNTIEAGDTVTLYEKPGDYKFDIVYDSLAKEQGFVDIKDSIGVDGIKIVVPEDAKPGNYVAELTIVDIDGDTIKKTIKFSVCYPSAYIVRLMNDVLSVTNQIHDFLSYQWYKNGEKIEGATEQYFCDLEGVRGVYKVQVVTFTGDTLFIAEREFEAIIPPFNVTLSKNPVNAGEQLTVTVEGVTDSNILNNSSLVVYDMKGTAVINMVGIDKVNTLTIGNTGEYIVVVRIAAGQTVSKHLLVK